MTSGIPLQTFERFDIEAMYRAGYRVREIPWPKATVMRVLAAVGMARRNPVKLSPADHAEILAAHARGERTCDIARRYNVSKPTIRRVRGAARKRSARG